MTTLLRYEGMTPVATESSLGDRITAALDALAAVGDADAIADHLYAAGDRGAREDIAACPVATYLQRALGDNTVVQVERSTWDVDDAGTAVTGPLPHDVCEFVDRFDDRAYPELVDPTQER